MEVNKNPMTILIELQSSLAEMGEPAGRPTVSAALHKSRLYGRVARQKFVKRHEKDSSDHRIFCLLLSRVFHVPLCKLQACRHVPFSQEWLLSGHSPIKPNFANAAETAILLAGSPISVKELYSSVRVVIGFLVTSLTKVLLAQLLSLVGRPALGRVWIVPYSFHFLMMELTVLLGTFNTRKIVLYPSPDLFLLTILSRKSMDSSMEFLGEFLL